VRYIHNKRGEKDFDSGSSTDNSSEDEDCLPQPRPLQPPKPRPIPPPQPLPPQPRLALITIQNLKDIVFIGAEKLLIMGTKSN
jgi:hypothetical protein